MPDRPPSALSELARLLGVATRYRDGLGRDVAVGTETLLGVSSALGAGVSRVADAAEAVARVREIRARELLAPVLVAWDGRLRPVETGDAHGDVETELVLEDGSRLAIAGNPIRVETPLPWGYHQLNVTTGTRSASATIVSAPLRSWRRSPEAPSWGVSAHLGALRSGRSRSVGDLVDLRTLCDWVGDRGGDLVTLLPLLPTFNDPPAEPSPYSPVSRLFWSELILDLGERHRPATIGPRLRVDEADREVRVALAGADPGPSAPDEDLARYAAFRGAQHRLGRDWRSWPERQRLGHLGAGDIDTDEERHHVVAQLEARRQLSRLTEDLEARVRLGLDLAVGVHPEGYDSWSRPGLFADGVEVGAPPDVGFPSGQSWGFPPVRPDRSRLEGHSYIAASIAHQASVAGVLRVDHIMAMNRLYWIPEGMGLHEGTYVAYPTEELFAVLCLESHRNRCEIIGENLGTVPPAIDEALPRHGIRGMYLAEFAASADGPMLAPAADEVAMIGTHDTPTLAGWLGGIDIDERVRLGLLDPGAAPDERVARAAAARRLATALGVDGDDIEVLAISLLRWLGGSASPLVSVWLEDLWLEPAPVNIPGSTSDERPNWQRPMARPLEELLADPSVVERIEALDSARYRPR